MIARIVPPAIRIIPEPTQSAPMMSMSISFMPEKKSFGLPNKRLRTQVPNAVSPNPKTTIAM